ncbi:MAG: SDR family oxidoreductase [Burkholderiaceae bacterium]|nr:SDR family oxidoreductase [Burkholderiaceae bacterium]
MSGNAHESRIPANRLAGRVALVTGAGGPMGRAIALRLAAEGATLMLTDISARRLEECVHEITASPGRSAVVAYRRADATHRDEIGAVVRQALERFGHVDILVNVVGGIRSAQLRTPFLEMSEEQWDSTFALNLKPAFHLVQQLAPGMIARAQAGEVCGRIVNIASVVIAGEEGQADYSAAKAGVAALTRTLAIELAPHINVNCVAPGLIRTSVIERIDASQRDEFVNKSVQKRLGEASEVAAVVAFLASDDASFMTGEILAASGGNHPAL